MVSLSEPEQAAAEVIRILECILAFSDARIGIDMAWDEGWECAPWGFYWWAAKLVWSGDKMRAIGRRQQLELRKTAIMFKNCSCLLVKL